ncbi:DUF3800 domain-containing protein [Mucilaginibacter sp. KACC 22063]|uniref:DUF3800 domain-containing protein n=1 Tax=Mucilaginibacter sp. KACC 22063 TaxID=3025666 RepID=UPI002366CF4A|nr:DUF3800 domain-containing protein [Mucilaginibacter sp. KACC 22063]WDF55314.1 DUF3800 domain-containing protein [Mucilaginibacter sp. KACC 22063]
MKAFFYFDDLIKNMLFNIYCDESRITKERFMVIGGIIVNSKSLNELSLKIRSYREQNGMIYELKWSKVSNNRIQQYKNLVDLIFELIEENRINFRSIIADTSKFNHRKYNGGDGELGFYKMYYQLLFHCFGSDYLLDNLNQDNSFIVFPDHKTTNYMLGELKSRLNNNMFYKLGSRSSPFRSIEPTDSKKSDFVQLVDILIGAIGYHKNELHLKAGASLAKLELSNYIALKFGLAQLGDNFKYKKRKFTVWNIKLR